MVNSGQVNSDCSTLKSVLDRYNSEIGSLNSNWKGPYYDSLNRKAEDFISEYSTTINGQMDAFATACDLYKKYLSSKQNLANAKDNYNKAVARNDQTNINSFSSQVTNYSNECTSLKNQIESYLSRASSTKLTATKNQTTSINVGGMNISTGYGYLDMSNYPTGTSREDGLARATLVAKYLMANGGFSKEQAAAMVAVYVDENNCTPGSVMEAEKAGKGVEGTGGNGYGAGIASWTFEDFKNQSLRDAGYPENTPIESLTMQQQCDMIIAMSQKSMKKYYDALKRCDTIEDASATAVIITGGIGFSDNWDTHPTPAEAKELADWYGRSNDKNYGPSEHHWGGDQRRLQLAKEIYEIL